jgi:hypothetical protein
LRVGEKEKDNKKRKIIREERERNIRFLGLLEKNKKKIERERIKEEGNIEKGLGEGSEKK